MTSGILPDVNKVVSIESVRAFSKLCEATCANLFAFSPFQLNIDSEEFLLFQCLADELKERLATEDASIGTLCNLCVRLNHVYEKLISSCWEAFVENATLENDPGKFVVRQMVAVEEFVAAVN